MQEGINMNKLIGVVAAGGLSSRMGQDKSKLIFHDSENELVALHLLSSVCDETYLSKNAKQATSVDPKQVLIDEDEYLHHGPATALLTAHQHFPDHAIFMLGCDYPYLRLCDVEALVKARHASSEITCYYQALAGFAEPLICIYEANARKNLVNDLAASQFSLQRFIQKRKTLYVVPSDVNILTSIDTPEQYKHFHTHQHER